GWRHLAVERHAQRHVRAAPAVRRPAPHAAEQRVARDAELAQRRGKERVVLEAVAAASFVEKLALEIADGETDAASGLNREVLEEERLTVRAMQPPQRIERGARGRAVLSQPLQIIVESHVRRSS